MKTTYLAWKDPACGGMNPQWEYLTCGKFLALVKSPEGKNRHFISLNSTSIDGTDGKIVIEATEKEHKAWLKEKRHRQYLRDSDPGYTLISYHAMETDDKDCYGEELLRDEDLDVEAECFKRFEIEALRAAVASLNDDERQMVEYLYLFEKPGTVRGYEKLAGISKSAVSRRKIAVLNKIKKFLSE